MEVSHILTPNSCSGWSWNQHINQYVRIRKLGGGYPRCGPHARFRGGICGCTHGVIFCVAGNSVDDAPEILCAHVRYRGSHSIHHGKKVHSNMLFEIAQFAVLQTLVKPQAGVIEKYIDATGLLNGGGYHSLDIVCPTYIQGDT